MNLVKNKFAKYEDKADFEVPEATMSIYEWIGDNLSRKGVNTIINRGSSATMCVKRRQMQGQGIVGEPLTPRKMVNFMLGDLTEMVVRYFIQQACVGPDKLYSEAYFGEEIGQIEKDGTIIRLYEQIDEYLTIEGLSTPVKVHRDGRGKRNSDGKWESIEVKSSASYGFDKFKEGDIGDYVKQAEVEMHTDLAVELGITQTRFFYLHKETGHIWDALYNSNPELWNEVKSDYLAAESKVELQPPHGWLDEMKGSGKNKAPTGRKILGFPCTYCPYTLKCHTDGAMEWKENTWSGFTVPMYVKKVNQ